MSSLGNGWVITSHSLLEMYLLIHALNSMLGLVKLVGTKSPWGLDYMMTSSNGNIFRVTGHLCGEFTGHRWIPRTKASNAELWCFLWCAPNGWVNNGEASDLRRHRAHYDVTVMTKKYPCSNLLIKTRIFKPGFWLSGSKANSQSKVMLETLAN